MSQQDGSIGYDGMVGGVGGAQQPSSGDMVWPQPGQPWPIQDTSGGPADPRLSGMPGPIAPPAAPVVPVLPRPMAPPPPQQATASVDEAPGYGRSVRLSAGQVEQVIRQRALDLLAQKGFTGDKLDFLLRAKVHRSPSGGATVTWEE